jgi:drug/metabolite transporter (DMT)-like permease
MSERKPHLDGSAVALIVGCCLLWGLNQVAAKAALPEVPALQQAALRSLGGALLVFSLAFQVVAITFASYLLWFWLMRHYPATRLASFTLLTPVFGLLPGALLLGEPITLRLQIALAAVALGIVLVNRVPARV